MASGLWHHAQRMLQPLKKTVVRIPGPSCTDVRWMFEIKPVTWPSEFIPDHFAFPMIFYIDESV
jgi:hypothetical protein